MSVVTLQSECVHLVSFFRPRLMLFQTLWYARRGSLAAIYGAAGEVIPFEPLLYYARITSTQNSTSWLHQRRHTASWMICSRLLRRSNGRLTKLRCSRAMLARAGQVYYEVAVSFEKQLLPRLLNTITSGCSSITIGWVLCPAIKQ